MEILMSLLLGFFVSAIVFFLVGLVGLIVLTIGHTHLHSGPVFKWARIVIFGLLLGVLMTYSFQEYFRDKAHNWEFLGYEIAGILLIHRCTWIYEVVRDYIFKLEKRDSIEPENGA